jgi:hypothetical protein
MSHIAMSLLFSLLGLQVQRLLCGSLCEEVKLRRGRDVP